MTRSIPEESTVRHGAGQAVDAALFQDGDARPTNENGAASWLLLRERTVHRLNGT